MVSSFVLWLVFSNSFGQRLGAGQQYAPYLMAGTLLNVFVSGGIIMSAQSILDHATILTKIYVKPQIFTLSSAFSSLINFAIGLIPLILVCQISGQNISLRFPLILFVALSMVLLVAGSGLILSVLIIRFSDIQGIATILLTLISYLTPLFYPITDLTERMQKIVNLNPLTSFLDCFRWSISNYSQATIFDWLYMFITSILVFMLGNIFFSKSWNKVIVMLG